MSLVAEFTLAGGPMPLTDVAAAVPATRLRIEEMRPNDDEPLAFVRASGGLEAFETAVADSSTATLGGVVETDETGRLYQVFVQPDDDVDLTPIRLSKAVFESAEVTGNGWTVRAMLADREELAGIRAFVRANGARFRLERLDDGTGDPALDLTASQREALVVAHEMGYFEVPRRASMADVAAELDIAPASLSERFRRAQTRLIERHLRSNLNSRTV